MEILSFGFKKPETGDVGATVFGALEDNIEQMNEHDHDGNNSSKLPGSSVVSVVSNILAATWTSLGGGHYKTTVNMPSGFAYDTTQIQVRLSNGSIIYPTIVKVSSTQFEIYGSDNTIDLKVAFN